MAKVRKSGIAVAITVLLAVAAAGYFFIDQASRDKARAAAASTAPPGIPVTVGIAQNKDMPVFLNADRHRPGLQHGHGQEPGRRPDHEDAVHGRPGGQGGRPAVPDRPAPLPGGARPGAGGEARRTRRSWRAPSRISTVPASWSARAIDAGRAYDQQKASVRNCRPRSRATRRRSTPPS